MAGISISNALNNKGANDIAKQIGEASKSRKAELKRHISDDKQKLNRLSIEDTAGKSKITAELSKYEKQLRQIEESEEQNKSEKNNAEQKRRFDSFECQTCKNRRYQDVSDDAGVSFQSAQHVDPSAAYSRVKAHEQEHVARNKTQAEQKGAKIAYQTVTIKRAICPECGRSYVSGGVTHTVTKADMSSKYTVGMFDSEKSKGNSVNAVA